MNNTLGVYLGRFQPLTKAHYEIIQEMARNNDNGIIYITSTSKKSIDKNPFPIDLRVKILEEICPSNITIKVVENGFLPDELNKLDYNTFNLYSGTDRVESYLKFNKYMENDKKINIVEVQRSDEDISATLVRKSLIEDDISTFHNLTNESTYKYFNILKECLMEQINEETSSVDVENFTKPLDDKKIDRRVSFKDFFKNKKKDKDVLQKQENE